jgi:cytoskeletal protein RodZ
MMKKIGIIILVVILVGLAWWYKGVKQTKAPNTDLEQSISADTSSAAINQDLQATETGSLTTDFTDINKDISGL